ncbi:hypothetical protein GQ607_002895 [Colletotrichum asianum]|uniref:Uncharacterized protein n=1 Tax=Colletotrichum asianum TaxID=702518 RepID=A0A8H3ZVU8_9PEZI|nr:hypothetical protein GQ607_002895 [Colletotrichum asianum]
MEGRTRQSRPKAHNSKGSQAIHCDRNDRQYLISWRPSIYFQLLIAWLMIFGILVTVRNFSPAGLSSWTYHFPECDPTDWRRPSSHRFRFLPNNPSCESQIAQLIGVEIVFWLNASNLLWNTDFGQRHVKWVFGITTAGTGLTMGLIQDPSPALLLVMPIILSVCSSIGFVIDVGR